MYKNYEASSNNDLNTYYRTGSIIFKTKKKKNDRMIYLHWKGREYNKNDAKIKLHPI